jgi:peroxiredoxin
MLNKQLSIMIVKPILLIILIIFIDMTFKTFAQNNNMNSPKDTTITTDSSESDMEACTILKAGANVPEFSINTLDGKTIRLSELRGKTVFLNFFTLSCSMCMKELPLFEKEIWPKFKTNKNIVILIIGREETVENLKAFRDKNQFTFPMAFDPERKVYSLFASKYVPRNIIIDKEGKLVISEVGFNDAMADELFQKIDNLLRTQ